MAVIYYVVKEGNYSATCLKNDEFPRNPPDNCDLTIIDTGKVYKSKDGIWVPAIPIIIQNNRWVDVIGDDTFPFGDGTIINPYRTIQKAIDSITGATASNPYIINIGIGTFIENIIPKDGLSFVGLNKHFLDTNINLTIISGDVTTTTTTTDLGFTGISFEGSGNTISFSGVNSANTVTSHFYNCKIGTLFSATTYSNIVINDVFFHNPTTNPIFVNNSILVFTKGIAQRGLDVDASSTLVLFGDSYFVKSLSNINGTKQLVNSVENFLYDNTKSGLISNNPQDAIDEINQKITVGTTAPTSPRIGDLWIDIN